MSPERSVTYVSERTQAHKRCFWFSGYIDGVEIVDGACIADFQNGFPARIPKLLPRGSSFGFPTRLPENRRERLLQSNPRETLESPSDRRLTADQRGQFDRPIKGCLRLL